MVCKGRGEGHRDNVVVRVEVKVIWTMVCKGRGEGHMDNGV